MWYKSIHALLLINKTSNQKNSELLNQIKFTILQHSDDPVPLLEPRQSLIAPCLGLGAHEAIAGYTEFSLQRCQ